MSVEHEEDREVILDIDDLHVEFYGRQILRGVSLKLHRGETLVVMGGSGCGKSTLLQTIIGAVPPSKGHINALGQCFDNLNGREKDIHRTKIGILFQSGALFQSMSSGENIASVVREHYPLSEEEIDILVKMKLEMVGLRHAEDLLPCEISGGMKKRVALARALALNPEIMLYDEPGAGLDPVTLAGVDNLISTLGRALNMGSIIVTHRIKSALSVADRMIFLHEGKILVQGTPEEMKNSDNPYLSQFLEGTINGPILEPGINDDYATALLGNE